MKTQRSPSSCFSRAVHRRLVIVRAIERGGACAAVAAVFAIALAGAMLWRGDDALALAVRMLTTGALVGLMWGVARRPRLLDAAIAADRQLDLADLLATALAVANQRDDPWARAVLAMADARFRSLSPDAIVLRKFGARAWGGIGLAGALVLTVGVLSTLPQNSRARQGSAAQPALSAIEVLPRPPDLTSVPPARTPKYNSASDSNAGDADDATRDSNSDASPPSASTSPRPSSQNPGGGEIAGQTPAGVFAQPHPSGVGQDFPPGQVATGGASSATPSDRPAASAGSSTGSVSGQSRTPPWQTPSWPSDRQAALEASHAGQVPDQYRDVLREYFQEH